MALAGDRAALAKVLSHVERGGDGADQIERKLAGRGGQGFTIGITGAPGAGKSTLLASLLAHVQSAGERAAALLVDPSSPVSRGALLGDRVRMQGIATQEGIFARSMASRGRVGGLADMTRNAARCLGACGWPWIFIETVGIGQVDIEVTTVADLVVVVLNPGAGDEVQVFKAGLMEIADVFVINKADHLLAGNLRHDLDAMISSSPAGRTRPPVVETIATTGAGIPQLWSVLGEMLGRARTSGELLRRRNERVGKEMLEIMSGLMNRRLAAIAQSSAFEESRRRVAAGEEPLHAAAQRLLT